MGQFIYVCGFIFLLILLAIAPYAVSVNNTVKNNTHIRDPVTTFDFVPLGVAIVQHPDGSLHLPEGSAWYRSNFAPFGMGTTNDGEHSIIYHQSIKVGVPPLAVSRVSVDGGDWITERVELPVYYNETGSKFGTGFPTVYVEQGDFFQYIAYDESNRTWYYKLQSPNGYINATAKAYSIPFWMGKAGGPYVVQGLYVTHEDLDLWGGYVDIASVTTESNFGGVERTYYGVMAMDREYHRELDESYFASGGWKGCFSAMSLHTDDVDMTVLQAVNPIDGSDSYNGVPFEHQGRINFPSRDKDFTFNDFQYVDDGEIPPESFHVEGSYEGGYVNLTAQTFQVFSWGESAEGTWWDENVTAYWGRNFVLWNGEITLNGETIGIEDAFGFGEFTRVSSETLPSESPFNGSVIILFTGVGIGIVTIAVLYKKRKR